VIKQTTQFFKGDRIMKRFILAGLTVATLAIAAASPASAITPRFREAHRMHNDVKAFTPALTTEANLNQRFSDARDANLNKLNPRFKEARDANLNKLNDRFESARERNLNKLNQRFKEARDANLNKLNPRFKAARDANVYN
jgi:DNA anti-recombination protein RmuC